MLFNPKIETDVKKAQIYFDKLIESGSMFELKKKIKRTIKQNSYYHVVLSILAIHLCLSMNECKTLSKRTYGLYYEKGGNKYLRSSADLDSVEKGEFIEWLLIWASKEHGCYIPSSDEYYRDQFKIDAEIDKYDSFLKG